METEVIPDGGNPDWLYNQGEPVLCSVEEYGEPRFPNYSSLDGSDGVRFFTVNRNQVIRLCLYCRHQKPKKMVYKDFQKTQP